MTLRHLRGGAVLIGTAAEFATANPVLLERQLSLQTDTGVQKIGDGTTHYADLGVVPGESPPTSGGSTHRLELSTARAAWSITADMAGDGDNFPETIVVTAEQVGGIDGGRYVTPGARFQSDTWPDTVDYLSVAAVKIMNDDGTLGDGSAALNSSWTDVAVITDGYLDLDAAMTAEGAPPPPKLTVAGVYTVYYSVSWTESA